VEVTGKVGDDHFHDVIWKWRRGLAGLEDPFVRGARPRGYIAKEAIELGFSPVPGGHHAGWEICPYKMSDAEIRVILAR